MYKEPETVESFQINKIVAGYLKPPFHYFSDTLTLHLLFKIICITLLLVNSQPDISTLKNLGIRFRYWVYN